MSQLARNTAITGAGALAAWGAVQLWRKSEVRAVSRRIPKRSTVAVLGCGFGGMNAAAELARLMPDRDAGSIHLIDRRSSLLFTPMLTEVVGGEVDAPHVVASPARISDRIQFERADVRELDLRNRRITMTRGSSDRLVPESTVTISADHLVISLGSEANYHGVPGLKEHSFSIKTVEEAVTIRNRALELLERAASETNGEVRRQLLTFVVAGGGYTGVETAAALNDLVREGARRLRMPGAGAIRVLIIEPGDRLMSETTPELASFAQRQLQERGVEVLLKTTVTGAGPGFVDIAGGERLASHLLIWAGGVKSQTLVETLDCPKGKHGGIVVDDTCAVPGRSGVWAIGDCAEIPNRGGTYAPTAQNATREGIHVARNIIRALVGQPLLPFRYVPMGELALTGRHSGVARVYGFEMAGWPVWLLWRSVYLLKMPERSQRFRIGFDWLLDLAFGRNMADVPW